jgi:hypothetical protein
MANDLSYSYAGIIKSEKQADGTIKVYGKATDDSIDIDQQICDEAWLKEAMPTWFKTGGNIREQHSSIAAGVATDYEAKSDGHYIEALIVDPTSVKKIEAGVLKGFSIGIRGPRVIRDAKAVGGRIVGGQIVEVSVVDRPANSNAKMTIAKAVDGELVEVEQTFEEKVTPASIAKTVIKPVGNTGSKVETMETVTKSDSPIEAVVDAVENVAHEVADVVDAVAHDVETVVADVEHVAPEVDAVAKEVEQVVEAGSGTVADEAEKSAVAGDIVKGDLELYNAAVQALANLIKAETDEIVSEGDDEIKDIKCLLKAMKHLNRWHSIEADKGELPVIPSDDAADDMVAPEEMLEDLELSATADKSATPELATDTLIEKAVKSAREAVEAELELLKSTTVRLEAELADALTKTVAGGPARAGVKPKTKHNVDDLLSKANEYRAKAANTEDRFLADGYLELADDLETKAHKG